MTLTIVENMSLKSAQGQMLLHDINCQFASSKVNMILGPNGSGKTLLLRCLAGLLVPSCGRIQIGTKKLKDLSLAERSRLLGWLPTHCHIPFSFSVFEILLMGRFPFHQGVISAQDRLICQRLLAELDIESLSARTYLSLSQGEQIKVQLARVLAADPSILVLDEICANLDIKAKIEVLKLLNRLSREKIPKTIILSHHDLHSVSGYCDHLVMIKDGKIADQGSVEESFHSANIEKVFGIKPRVWRQVDQESLSLVF